MQPLVVVRKAGFTPGISPAGGLLIEPASRLTDAQRAYIRAHKVLLLAAQRKWGMRLKERGFTQFTNNGAWWRGLGLTFRATEGTEPTEPKKAVFRSIDFSKSSYGKTAFNGSVGSVGSVSQSSPPVEPAFEGRDVEEF